MRTAYRSSAAVLALRSAALFIVLYQFRIVSGELADTPIFVGALFSAFAFGFSAARSTLSPPFALAATALAPLLVRALPLLGGLFLDGPALAADSLLPTFDRNFFVALLPWYWAALGTYGAARSRRFLRFELIFSNLLPILLFSAVKSSDFAPYHLPILMMGLFALLLTLQFFTLLLSAEVSFAPSRREAAPAALIALLAVLIAAGLLIRPSEERAVDQGGGLLKPNLFRFDFSQFLRLESEISLNDDLALIVRKDADDSHILLRRFVLSGYHPKRGFFRQDDRDEAIHPQRLPDSPTDLPGEEATASRRVRQEYFLVNFDPSAFIAMNRPVRVVPFSAWDASSFSSAYSVESEVVEALPFELMDSVQGSATPEALGLSEEDYRWYTDFGGDERIAEYAAEMVAGMEGYWDRVQAIYERLRYGEYRYSLKPGIAADGDQLSRFLFDAKRGYCSYFAFSMALLLRSQGIPARVAVGFFLDPLTNTFDYYPIRSDMAHAWVEVLYPGIGWVEYDPTTDITAEGEDIRFTRGVPQDLFERLMSEILENRYRLTPKEAGMPKDGTGFLPALAEGTLRFFRRAWAYLAAFALFLLSLGLRVGCIAAARLWARRPRRSAGLIGAHTEARLAFAGYRRRAAESPLEFARRFDGAAAPSLAPLAPLAEALAGARFAPRFTHDELLQVRTLYSDFSKAYRLAVPPGRRLLAWVLPPLALLLPPAARGRRGTTLRTTLPLLLAFSLFSADRLVPQDAVPGADLVYEEALEAQRAERWEQAIELFKRGAEAYIDDVRFPWALGDLYQSRKLYSLAWDEYRKAEPLAGSDPELFYQLSTVAGRLNRNDDSAAYLERVAALRPEDRDAIGDLAWMYFKLHRLADGEALLLDALSRLGPDRGFSMTLGTIYSDQFKYEESKARYLESIADADAEGAKIFSAVAHYNLSILESRHYKFSEAFARTTASLAAAERASGHLAKGELHLRRLEFPMTFAEYLAAYEIDSSPLSKINMAQAYQISGRLEEARAYGEETLETRDLSWMLNYGTDIDRHRRDLHEILADTYAGLAEKIRLSPAGTWTQALKNSVEYFRRRYAAAVHRKLYSAYSLKVARAYDAAGQELDALVNYYNAFKGFPSRARRYLSAAEKFETALVPKAAASYKLEEGILLGRRDQVEAAPAAFDPVWERDLIAEAYAYLAKPRPFSRNSPQARDAAERLYALNRGALRQRGISLPVQLEVTGPDAKDSTAARLGRTLAAAGILPVQSGTPIHPVRYRLRISISAAGAECELRDMNRGIVIVRRILPPASLSRKDRAAFAAALAEALFVAD